MVNVVVKKFQTLFLHRYWPIFLAVFCLLLTAPVLRGHLKTDDLFHRVALQGSPELFERGYEVANPERGFLDTINGLFSFMKTSDDSLSQLQSLGVAPWWADPDMQLAFWRPLSAATHWLDYQLWPDNPTAMLFHDMVWFSLLVLVVSLLFRELKLPLVTAGLASLLYAIDFSFSGPLSWVANRNGIIAAFFGMTALLLHIRWRGEGGILAGLLAPLVLLLALLSAEAGIASVAYIGAYAFCLDRGNWRQRILSLLPAFLVVVGWRVLYRYLDYGALNTGLYLDPIQDGLIFFAALLERLPFLMFSQFTGVDGVYNPLSPEAKSLFLGFAVALLLIFFIAFLPMLRKQAVARFFLMGAVLAAVPSCAVAFPGGRLLFFVAVGASGLVAMLLDKTYIELVREYSSNVQIGITRVVRLFSITIHLVITPLVWILVMISLGSGGSYKVPSDINIDLVRDIDQQDIVVVNAPNPFMFLYVMFYREYSGMALPKTLNILTPAYADMTLTRLSENAFEVSAPLGLMLSARSQLQDLESGVKNPLYVTKTYNSVFRGSKKPFVVGETYPLPSGSVRIEEVSDIGEPVRVRYEIEGADQKVWLSWDKESKAYVQLPIPEVGQLTRFTSTFPN